MKKTKTSAPKKKRAAPTPKVLPPWDDEQIKGLPLELDRDLVDSLLAQSERSEHLEDRITTLRDGVIEITKAVLGRFQKLEARVLELEQAKLPKKPMSQEKPK